MNEYKNDSNMTLSQPPIIYVCVVNYPFKGIFRCTENKLH